MMSSCFLHAWCRWRIMLHFQYAYDASFDRRHGIGLNASRWSHSRSFGAWKTSRLFGRTARTYVIISGLKRCVFVISIDQSSHRQCLHWTVTHSNETAKLSLKIFYLSADNRKVFLLSDYARFCDPNVKLTKTVNGQTYLLIIMSWLWACNWKCLI